MPENPLLPHAELQALLSLTKRCAALGATAARKAPQKPKRGVFVAHTSREAMLAAATLQLKTGDLLVPDPGDSVAIELSPHMADQHPIQGLALPPEYTRGTSRLLLSAALAAALQGAGTDRVVLTLAQAGDTDPGWSNAMTWAQNRLLPLVLVFTDASGSAIFTQKRAVIPTLTSWGSVSRHAAKQKVPILTVDGEDAVAVYRTAQEAILRARTGGGPAVLWAALPTPAELKERSRTLRPVPRLAQYLRTRDIPVS